MLWLYDYPAWSAWRTIQKPVKLNCCCSKCNFFHLNYCVSIIQAYLLSLILFTVDGSKTDNFTQEFLYRDELEIGQSSNNGTYALLEVGYFPILCFFLNLIAGAGQTVFYVPHKMTEDNFFARINRIDQCSLLGRDWRHISPEIESDWFQNW